MLLEFATMLSVLSGFAKIVSLTLLFSWHFKGH
jgi:hypothetical protein